MNTPAIVFDLEGTLTDDGHRSHLQRVGEYERYRKLFKFDQINIQVADLLRVYHDNGVRIIILTAKPEEDRQAVIDLLKENKLPFDLLMMRPKEDMRPSPDFKLDIAKSLNTTHDIGMFYDDRKDVCDILFANGFNVTIFSNGTFVVYENIENDFIPEQEMTTESFKHKDKGKHYRYTYKGIKLDPARICMIYGITNMVQAGIVKKALCAGKRGHKDKIKDIEDIITAAERLLQMIKEDEDGNS